MLNLTYLKVNWRSSLTAFLLMFVLSSELSAQSSVVVSHGSDTIQQEAGVTYRGLAALSDEAFISFGVAERYEALLDNGDIEESDASLSGVLLLGSVPSGKLTYKNGAIGLFSLPNYELYFTKFIQILDIAPNKTGQTQKLVGHGLELINSCWVVFRKFFCATSCLNNPKNPTTLTTTRCPDGGRSTVMGCCSDFFNCIEK